MGQLSIRENRAATADLAKAAMFTALAVGAGYALLLIPNVELITAIVFAAGVYLGPRWGVTVGALAEFIFSAMNPMGSGLVFWPLLTAQITSISLAGLSGGIMRNTFLTKYWPAWKIIFLATVGVILTFVYDTLTTLSYPVAAGFEWKQTVVLYLSGIGFTALHEASNAVIFFTALPRLFSRIQ